mmetsp:Transcript_115071/g.221738  ORF Transcript_115071/g.221738 Transcript_115071/m.221738 type:complete len:222 (-) Transcript_115071:393-1058(-)
MAARRKSSSAHPTLAEASDLAISTGLTSGLSTGVGAKTSLKDMMGRVDPSLAPESTSGPTRPRPRIRYPPYVSEESEAPSSTTPRDSKAAAYSSADHPDGTTCAASAPRRRNASTQRTPCKVAHMRAVHSVSLRILRQSTAARPDSFPGVSAGTRGSRSTSSMLPPKASFNRTAASTPTSSRRIVAWMPVAFLSCVSAENSAARSFRCSERRLFGHSGDFP